MPSGESQSMSKVENPSAFKHWISPELVKKLGAEIKKNYSAFDLKQFQKIIPCLTSLELKPRVQLIRDELANLLPKDFRLASSILLKASESEKLKGFDLWAITEFIQVYGLKHHKISLEALYILTNKFTCEFAIRPFLINHQHATLKQLEIWTQDKNYHVRRWVSEGSRPRLPWGEKLTAFVKDPTLTLPLLEKLKYDPELYVRKSVANHLNDITKDHPKLITVLLKKWKTEAKSESTDKIDRINWIIRHALRVLIKKGNADALALMGVKTHAKIKVQNLKLNKKNL